MIGFTAVLAYRPMAVRRKNGLIGLPEIGITSGVFPIRLGQGIPERRRPLGAAVAHMDADDFPGLPIQGEPNPLLIDVALKWVRSFEP